MAKNFAEFSFSINELDGFGKELNFCAGIELATSSFGLLLLSGGGDHDQKSGPGVPCLELSG